ncbi:MAG: asparagine synthase (glutamine-hydrolyzing) [Candidatus Eisenbacteria bacterium]|nr:asparagine synthase (glutamine-hydrolyzing) [Candidatus Latescibacterota bacterium]MBD3301929.1 asparagine synthase (glutamine-hydrolyzing) [Candidatus Eisenbacteria bacterium]
MCGIAGILSADPDVRRRVGAMVAALAHRGPDDEGIEDLDRITLGHRRLSIVDLGGGHQPMFSADRSLAVVFNGEIYNFPRLREELERAGRRFATRCDTEILLHLYEIDGDDCVLRLEGMFAFALWDARRRRLLLARDHLGQKPLFFAETNGALAFASEVKGILAADLIPRRIDLTALYHYISLRFLPDDHSLFEGIHKLPAAHRLIVENGRARMERYWDLSRLEKIEGGEEDLLASLDAVLNRTVADHRMSDVPVGTFLSGGIDSSLITAILARQTGEPIPTFSIGVKEEGFNELPYARKVAAQYGTRHHEEVVAADLVHRVPRMIRQMDEPVDPFAVGVYLVSGLAAREVKVVLSGDGGDELFAGYDRFSGHRLAGRLAFLPPSVRRRVVRPLIDALPESFAYKGLTQKLRWLNEMSLYEDGERYAESMSFLRFTEEAKARLFTPDVRARLAGIDSRAKILEPFERIGSADPVDAMLYTDLMTRIPDHLLPIVDRMAMAHGLEVRPPLLEHRMVEYAMRIPAQWKLRGRTLKYLLRRLAERYVDPELVRRKKQGFGFPLAYWMQNELAGFLRRAAAESRFAAEGIFDRAYVQTLIEEHIAGRRDHNYRIWVWLNLEIWHRLYFEQAGIDAVTAWIEREVA